MLATTEEQLCVHSLHAKAKKIFGICLEGMGYGKPLVFSQMVKPCCKCDLKSGIMRFVINQG